MILDRAFTVEEDARLYLAGVLGADIHRLTIRRVDMVNDSTVVDVRFARPARTATPLDDRIEDRIGDAADVRMVDAGRVSR